ncbi:Imm53 family immunity protein [Bradyrhizobium betae]
MQDAGDVLERLERWYAAQCNGDWEHTYGITIETLDNPGWSFKVELRDTYLSGRMFVEIAKPQSSDHRDFFIVT